MFKVVLALLQLFIVPLLLLVKCSGDPIQNTGYLKSQGYSDIKIHEGFKWVYSGCEFDDSYVTKFTAKGHGNIIVKGVVCEGWFQGKGVRIDNNMQFITPSPDPSTRDYSEVGEAYLNDAYK